MTDIAELGLVVRSDGVVVASKRLKDLEGQAGSTEKMVALLGRTMAAAMAAFSVNKLIDYADAWSDMQSRVGAAIKDMEAAPALLKRIADIANASYSPLQQTVEIYGRNVGVLRELGLGARQAADYTESLNHMLVITATRGERAASVQNALSKAMAMGKLTGEGLETVLASGGRVAEALAGQLDTTVNGLRQMATDGKITSAVIAGALLGSLESVRVEAGEMAATVGDAWTIMNNNVTAAIGTMDQAYGISGRLAEGIILLANNLDLVATGVVALASGVTVMLIPAIVGATGAMWAFTASLLSNPLTAVAVIVALVVARVVTLIAEVGGLSNAFQHVQMTALDAFERVKAGGASMYHAMEVWAFDIASMFIMTWTRVQNGFFDMIQNISGAMGVAIPGMDAWEAQLERGYAQATDLHNKALAAREKVVANLTRALGPGSQMDIVGQGTNWKEFNGTFNAGVDGGAVGGAGALAMGGVGGGGKTDPYASLIRGAHDYINAKNLEIQTLGMATEAAALYRNEQELLNKAANDNITLSPTQRAEIEALAQAMTQAEMSLAGVQYAMSNTDPFREMESQIANLNAALASGALSWEQYGAAAMRANAGAASSVLGLASGMTGALAQMFQDNKAFAVGNAVVSTAEAVMKALATYGPTPWGFAAAGIAAATGAAQVATIMSATKGSSSTGGGVSGGSAGNAAAAPAKSQDINVVLQGQSFGRDQIRELLEQIGEASGDGITLNVRAA